MNQTLCDRWEDYHDGEMPAGSRAAFAEHLAGCLDCQQKLETLTRCEFDLLAAWHLHHAASDEWSGADVFDVEAASHAADLPSPRHRDSALGIAISRRGRRLGVPLVAAVALLILLGISFLNWNSPAKQQMVADPENRLQPSVEVQTPIAEPVPSALVDILLPTIAGEPQVHPGFTFVEIYPIFEVRPVVKKTRL
ncbi:MAG TPA: zf-HC2 domain-containing protein [Pirellulaceae bacterium]|nr:zf-HC2 domain-containing protein [Pirellulaceae bacterium]